MTIEKPSGPYPVAVCDAHMPESSNPAFRLRLFYPTTDIAAASAARAQWCPPSSARVDSTIMSILRFARIPLAPLLALPLSYLGKMELPAAASGVVADTADRALPLMLFSHGLGGAIGNYSNFCMDAASHGMLVVAPEHTDGSAFEAVLAPPSDTPIPYVRFSAATHGSLAAFRGGQLRTRSENMHALLNVLHGLHKGTSDAAQMLRPLRSEVAVPMLQGRVDFQQVYVAGHSFGAATTLLLGTDATLPHAMGTPRALICLDAWLLPLKERLRTVQLQDDARVLFIDQAGSAMADSIGIRQRFLQRVGGPKIQQGDVGVVQVATGLHNDASDFPLRVPTWIANTAGMTMPKSDPAMLLARQNCATRAFLDGPDTWLSFRSRVVDGEEPGLCLGPSDIGEN